MRPPRTWLYCWLRVFGCGSPSKVSRSSRVHQCHRSLRSCGDVPPTLPNRNVLGCPVIVSCCICQCGRESCVYILTYRQISARPGVQFRLRKPCHTSCFVSTTQSASHPARRCARPRCRGWWLAPIIFNNGTCTNQSARRPASPTTTGAGRRKTRGYVLSEPVLSAAEGPRACPTAESGRQAHSVASGRFQRKTNPLRQRVP
jgi:hypothetical protein